ncbi:MAG: TRAP transporter small permease [Methylobacteriaceae bacterium]|jgi:TRAP-type C4-dicarboxylate transport system permease small subunit|nr:TRAP transporter small permease [Methylobacteriaceae bacterium]
MSILKKIYQNFEANVCVALIAVMIICLTAQVAVRVLTGGAVAWAEEVSRFCFISAVYLGTAVGAQKLTHVRVTAQFMFFPVHIRLIFRMIADAILFAFNLFLAWLCYGIVVRTMQYGEYSATLHINVAFVEAVIPLGAALMNWRILESYYLHWKNGTLNTLVALETEMGLGTEEGAKS